MPIAGLFDISTDTPVDKVFAKINASCALLENELVDELKEHDDKLKRLSGGDKSSEEIDSLRKCTATLIALSKNTAAAVSHKTVKLRRSRGAKVEAFTVYEYALDKLIETIKAFLERPGFSIKNLTKYFCCEVFEDLWTTTYTVGGGIAGFVVGGVAYAALAATPAGWAIIVAAVVGALIGGGIGYYNAPDLTPRKTQEQIEREEFIAEMAHFAKNDITKEKMDKLKRILNEYILKPLRAESVDESECSICKEEPVMCPHDVSKKDKHAENCWVQPFTCKHALCFRCSKTVDMCPICRNSERKFSRS